MKALLKALSRARVKIPEIKRDTQAYNYKYATYPSILKAVVPHLRAEGIEVVESVNQKIDVVGLNDVLTVQLIHLESEQTFNSSMTLPKTDKPQDKGSVFTYYRRYLLCGLLNICPDEDTDGKLVSKSQPSDYPLGVTKVQYNNAVSEPQDAPLYNEPTQTNGTHKPHYDDPANAPIYVVPFGKFKGRALESLESDEVYSYLDWLERKAQSDGKSPSNNYLLLKKEADAFYSG